MKRVQFVVTYKTEKDYTKTYAQNANPYIATKSFETLEEAQNFCKTVKAKHIWDCTTGKIITKF